MLSVSKRVILLAAATSLWGRVASADEGSATAPPAAQAANAEATPPISDAELQALADAAANGSGETIEIFDERPNKPFDRDTEVRLTGEQLAARGATDLATALALLPDVTVRSAGRGGFNIDVRGGRKGEVTILIDGVLVTDPYYGTFDLSSIPITDIVQIRVSTTPQSPIDGPGGSGGVIEVHTRDAFGGQQVIARLQSDTLGTGGVAGTIRFPITDKLALRASASGVDSGRTLDLPKPFFSIDQQYRDANGASRLEYRDGTQRVALDAFVDDRHYFVPPSDTSPALLLVDRETSARSNVKFDDTWWGDTQVQAEAWGHYLLRQSKSYTNPFLSKETEYEDLHGFRQGGQLLATRVITKELRWAASVTVDRESVAVGGLPSTPVTRGDTTIVEGAGDLQYEHKTVRLDGALGVAVPFGVGANPWPEGKLVGKWRPNFGNLELTATLGRKGRVPSLQERFEPGEGNPALGPELTDHAEIRAIEHIGDAVHVEVAPFYRYQTGTVALDQNMADATYLKDINLGNITIKGVDTLGRIRVLPKVEVGGGYSYIIAYDDSTHMANPIQRLPHNRWEAWVQAFPRSDLSGLVRVVYFGANSAMNQALPGYATLEVTATWNINQEYMLVLRGEDLTNTRPELLPGVYGPGATVYAVFQGTWL